MNGAVCVSIKIKMICFSKLRKQDEGRKT